MSGAGELLDLIGGTPGENGQRVLVALATALIAVAVWQRFRGRTVGPLASRVASDSRREMVRAMAARGIRSDEIARALGMSVDAVSVLLRQSGRRERRAA